jgi:hypothetical protein
MLISLLMDADQIAKIGKLGLNVDDFTQIMKGEKEKRLKPRPRVT